VTADASRYWFKPLAETMIDPRVIDPDQAIVQRAGLDDSDLDQIVAVLNAIRTWREADQRMRLATRSDMEMNETDMRALRYLIAAESSRADVSPRMLAEYLGISSASTTKALDRLSGSGHVTRSPHPEDGRAVIVRVTPKTHEDVRRTLGRRHEAMFAVAAQLAPEEREIVIRFLSDLSAVASAADAPHP
jgi:DNA-binding MarR family transcriptional regulator